MGYNKGLDKEIKAEDVEVKSGQIRVAVYSYNGGEAKLQIGPRMYVKRDGGTGYGKLGRMTVDETARVLKAVFRVQSALEG